MNKYEIHETATRVYRTNVKPCTIVGFIDDDYFLWNDAERKLYRISTLDQLFNYLKTCTYFNSGSQDYIKIATILHCRLKYSSIDIRGNCASYGGSALPCTADLQVMATISGVNGMVDAYAEKILRQAYKY